MEFKDGVYTAQHIYEIWKNGYHTGWESANNRAVVKLNAYIEEIRKENKR